MKILVLNGSPHPQGSTKDMVNAFKKGAESAGHIVDVVDVCFNLLVINRCCCLNWRIDGVVG